MTLTHNLAVYCENCKARIPNAPPLRTRLNRVNSALALLGRTYWETVSEALSEVEAALQHEGFSLPEDHDTYDAHALLPVGEGKYLSLNLYRMASGRYEVTAYVN